MYKYILRFFGLEEDGVNGVTNGVNGVTNRVITEQPRLITDKKID